eukprot:116795-Rhodomonas_salina.1
MKRLRRLSMGTTNLDLSRLGSFMNARAMGLERALSGWLRRAFAMVQEVVFERAVQCLACVVVRNQLPLTWSFGGA